MNGIWSFLLPHLDDNREQGEMKLGNLSESRDGVRGLINLKVGLNPKSSCGRESVASCCVASRKRSELITFSSSVWFTWRNTAASTCLQILIAHAFPRAHFNLILLLAARAGYVCRLCIAMKQEGDWVAARNTRYDSDSLPEREPIAARIYLGKY